MRLTGPNYMGPDACTKCGGSGGGGPDPATRCPRCQGDGCEPTGAASHVWAGPTGRCSECGIGPCCEAAFQPCPGKSAR
jgi:hypothetical protein